MPSLTFSNLTDCPRCGGTHKLVRFAAFQRPIVDNAGTTYTYFGLCPTTHQPILCRKYTPTDTLSENDGQKTNP